MMIGENIRKYRKAASLTLKELGEALNFAENTVSQWERGRNEPDLKTIIKIAEVLDIPLSALFYSKIQKKSSLELAQMLILSTAHVSEETSEFLDKGGSPLIVYPKDEYGWMIPVIETLNEENKNEIPSDLYNVLEFALKRGCTWVMLDRDADIIEKLPQYEW